MKLCINFEIIDRRKNRAIMSEIKPRGGGLHGINSHCKVCGDRASGKHYGLRKIDLFCI